MTGLSVMLKAHRIASPPASRTNISTPAGASSVLIVPLISAL